MPGPAKEQTETGVSATGQLGGWWGGGGGGAGPGGGRLVDECERFARARGYRRIVLWTNSVLVAARAIYARAGYVLTKSEPHESFGHPLVGETWERVFLQR